MDVEAFDRTPLVQRGGLGGRHGSSTPARWPRAAEAPSRSAAQPNQAERPGGERNAPNVQ